jgi:hypothetical protein
MALYPVGVPAFDQAARSAQATRDAVERIATTQAQMTAAAKNYLVAVIAAAATNGVAVPNEQTALAAILQTGST